MAIDFLCPTCNGTLRVGDESAGRVIRCGACRTMLRVPGAALPPPPPPMAAVPVAPPRAKRNPPSETDAEPNVNVVLVNEPLDAELLPLAPEETPADELPETEVAAAALHASADEPRAAELAENAPPGDPTSATSPDAPRDAEPLPAVAAGGRSWDPDWNNPYDRPRRNRDDDDRPRRDDDDRPRRERDDRPRQRRRRPPPPPRGRGVLFWLLMLGGVFALLTVGCCGGLYLVIPGPKWQKHESARGGFKVDLPAAPRNDMDNMAGGKPDPGAPMEGTILFGRFEEYAIVYRDIPAHELRFATDKHLLDEAVKGMKESGEVESVLRQKDITVGGFPAREVEFSAKGGGWFASRIIIADSRVYVIVAGGRFAKPGNENARRFLDSFEITDPKLKTAGQKKANAERQQAEEVARREEEQRVTAERARRVQEHAQKMSDAEAAFIRDEYEGPTPGRVTAKAGDIAVQSFDQLTRWDGRAAGRSAGIGGPGVRGTAWYLTPGELTYFRAFGQPRPNPTPSASAVDPNGYSVAGWVRVRYIPITPVSVHATYGKEEPLAEITAGHTHVTARIAGPNGTVEFKHAWEQNEKWHHVALVRSPKGAKLYLDGVSVATSDAVAPPLPSSVCITFGWMRYTDPNWPGPPDVDGKPTRPTGLHLAGAVDECLVIARALTDDEVAELAGRKTPPDE